MKILFVTNTYLDSYGGGTFASIAFANAFAEVSNNCILLFPDRGNGISDRISSKYEFVGVFKKKNFFKYFIDFYLGRIHRFNDKAQQIFTAFKPDIVVFDNSRCSYGLIEAFSKNGTKVITIHHNFELDYYKSNPPLFIWRSIFLHHIKQAEGQAVKYSNINFTLTNYDLKILQQKYDSDLNSCFINLGIFESKKITKYDCKDKLNNTLNFVITGSLDPVQTEVSLINFLKYYNPILLKLFPKSKLIISGKNPSKKFIKTCNYISNVDLIINPTNILEIVCKGDIYICPIYLGGGIKLRILDGLKCGLPVLTHSLSARGYEVFLDHDFMMSYNDIISFENCLLKLIKIKEMETNLSSFIKEKYQDVFDFKSGVEFLKRELDNNLFN